jgi:hypothetical protein
MTHSYDYKLYAIKMEYFQKKINTNKVFIPDIAKKWSKQGESNPHPLHDKQKRH